MARLRPRLRTTFSALVVAMSTGAAGVGAEGEPQKRVLVLYSDRIDLPSNVVVDRVLRVELQKHFGLALDLHGENVETARFPDEEYVLALRDFVQRKYAGRRFDAVIGVARPAMLFLQAYARDLFGETPIIALSGDDVVTGWRGPPLTGVIGSVNMRGTVDLLFRLHPETRQLVVVSGTSSVDRRSMGRAQQVLAGERRAAVTYMSGLALEEMLDRLSDLPSHSVVFFASMSADATGRRFRSADVLSRVVAHTRAPVYVSSVAHLGSGAVGGVLVDQAAMAAETAHVAVRVLKGERAQDIPVVETAATPIVDVRQLRRWRIDESRLPPGTSVRFREASVWDSNKWYILGTGFVCAVQGTLIAGLLIQRRRRKHAEQEAQLQRLELTHLSRVATLGELTGALSHELSQPLTAIMCTAKAARRFLAREPLDIPELRESLDEIVEADERASDVIHRLRGFLKKNGTQRHPVDLNAVVADALKLARNDLLERSVQVATQLDSDLPTVLGDRVELQQVLLNLILNASDAMGSLEPGMRLLAVTTARTRNGLVRVAVSDQGRGVPDDVESLFEPFFTSKEQGLGLGLAICRSIVNEHGGAIRASANPDRGATFSFTLPARDGALLSGTAASLQSVVPEIDADLQPPASVVTASPDLPPH